MKILAFADFPSPYRVEVFKGLNEHYDLTVFFDKMSDQNRHVDWFCKDAELNSYSLLNDEGVKQFKKELKNIKKYDLVLAYDYHIKNAIKLELACMTYGVPYVMNLDGAFIRRNPIKNLVKRFLITHAAGFFASGKYAKEYFLHFGAKEEKIFIHPFTSLKGSDVYLKPADQIEKEQLRKELRIQDMPTVVSIGQFIHRKGFDMLLDAWKDLDENNQLLIIGGGEQEEQYKQKIKNNCYKNVHLVGFKPKEEVFKYYRASDLFVLPTREDIWGLVVNESMACGIPVIATDRCVAGMELIENGVNGYIVPTNNTIELYSAIKKCLSEDTCQMQYNNIEKIKQYTYENVVMKHTEAIEKILCKGDFRDRF